VVPSLDAGTEEIFMKVNRPVPGLDFETIKKGIADFIKEFNGKTWLEVFILKGLSDTKEQIEKMAEFTRIASPDRVQLNTTARPACEKFALPVSHRKMVEIKKAFPEPVEIIADFSKPDNIKSGSLSKDILINLLSRRPCTATDISKSLGAHYNEVIKLTEQLTRNKTIESEEKNGKIFYKSVKNA
jgi:wyosine [tRNA(Phe)-imidazoG37] synthetase (radical SAM superfamily)